MPSVAVSKFNVLSEDVLKGVHDFSSDVFKVLLTNTAPVAGNSIKSALTEIAAGNGYSAGGAVATVSLSRTGGTTKMVIQDLTFTASGGSIGPFRYVVLYNDSSPSDSLICWMDYGSAVTLASGEPFKVNFNTADGLFTLS